MSLIVELIPDPEQGGFTARLPDLPAYGEGATEQAALDDLREALSQVVVQTTTAYSRYIPTVVVLVFHRVSIG